MSIKEIKKITGFSYSTISRVLNGKAKEFRISDKTCRTILETAEKLDYRPNILARSLRLQKTMTIGLIVPDIQNPFFGELASRIERLLRQHGYSTILCNTNEIQENEEFYLKLLVDRKVDGIILAPIHTEEWNYLEKISKETSVVLVDRIFYNTGLSWVTSDNTLAAERMTKELINLEYRRIAFLGGIPDTYINSVRYEGYQNALRKNFLNVDKDLMLFQGYSTESGEIMMHIIVEREFDVEAVFCVNNLVFLGAMKIVQEHEKKTNQPILMAAFDISHYCDLFKRPLVCANQDLVKLANSVVALLISKINEVPNTDHHLILPMLVEKYRLD